MTTATTTGAPTSVPDPRRDRVVRALVEYLPAFLVSMILLPAIIKGGTYVPYEPYLMDLRVYHLAVEDMVNGRDIYLTSTPGDNLKFIYPPIAAILMTPAMPAFAAEQAPAATEQAALRANFSERGFSTPPGALIGALNSSEIRASEAIADINRQQNIRNAEIKLDLLKFAEEQAIRLKLGIMGEVANFYGHWIELMNKDVDTARAKAQAYAALSSALSSYYNVELGFEELRLRAAQGRLEADVQQSRADMVEGEVRAAQNSALAQAARAIGDISGAAANARSSLQADIFSGSV